MLFAGMQFQYEVNASLYIGAEQLALSLELRSGLPTHLRRTRLYDAKLESSDSKGVFTSFKNGSISLNVSKHTVPNGHSFQLYAHSQFCSHP